VYGNIPLAVWEEFVVQKKMAEAVALSVQQKEKAMKAATPIAWVREDMLPKWQNGGRRKKKGG
jgi:hypothetical protein